MQSGDVLNGRLPLAKWAADCKGLPKPFPFHGDPGSPARILKSIKRSGFGRELGKFGIEEFVNKKLIRTVTS